MSINTNTYAVSTHNNQTICLVMSKIIHPTQFASEVMVND